MEAKTIWVKCQLDESGEPCYFPGHNLQQATAKAIRFFDSLAIPPGDYITKEHIPRKRIVTPRRLRKKKIKQMLLNP